MKIFINLLSKKYALVVLLLSLFITSCKKHDPDVIVTGEAKIKLINATQTESDQEVYVDDEKLSTAGMSFGSNSEYLKVKSGSRNVKFAGTSGINTIAQLNFTPSFTYSAFLVADKTGAREILTFEDNLSNTEMNTAKVRLINLTPFYATGINVSLQTGLQFVNALLYKETTNYFSVDTGVALRYNVVGAGSIKTIGANALEAGKIYTIWFSGATTTTIEAHLIVNN